MILPGVYGRPTGEPAPLPLSEYTEYYDVGGVTQILPNGGNWTSPSAGVFRLDINSQFSRLVRTGDIFGNTRILATIFEANDAGLMARMPASNNRTYYLCNIKDNLAQDVARRQTAWLFKRVNGVFTALSALTAISFIRGTEHTAELIVNGSNITFNYDGVTIITATDSDISAAGYAGIHATNNAPQAFKNVFISSI